MRSAGRDLGLADGIAHGLDLAIDVRFGNIVQIDQGQAADGAARQRFDDPGADAAHADHAHVGGAETVQCGGAIQAGNAAETWRSKSISVKSVEISSWVEVCMPPFNGPALTDILKWLNRQRQSHPVAAPQHRPP